MERQSPRPFWFVDRQIETSAGTTVFLRFCRERIVNHLFHVSEEPAIKLFEPRPSKYVPDPVVWAIDEARLHNYLMPRDCPRVTYYAGSETSSADVEQLLGSSSAVVALESAWFSR